jgi:elongation factor G
MTVWRQADRYEVPRIIYLNKMDKVGACFNTCIKHIENKLKCKPLQVHIPIGSGKSFRGVIDLVDLSKKEWSSNHNSLGTSYSTKLFNIFIHSNMTLYIIFTLDFCYSRKLDYEGDRDIWVEASEQRAELIDKMADLDDNLANLIIERESLQKINPVEMNQALRRITLARVSLQFSFTQDNAVIF